MEELLRKIRAFQCNHAKELLDQDSRTRLELMLTDLTIGRVSFSTFFNLGFLVARCKNWIEREKDTAVRCRYSELAGYFYSVKEELETFKDFWECDSVEALLTSKCESVRRIGKRILELCE